ncbi:MAG: CDP-glucose 4,6-dehydratase [Bosea sp. (in: a-proteobacteria)]
METLDVTQALIKRAPDPAFWRGRRVLVTGHTGFKGGWACLWLSAMGAEVSGFSRAPDQKPALFDLAGVDKLMSRSVIGDLAEPVALKRLVSAAGPEIVLHMAAQPLVRRSIRHPVETFRSNVMGTINLLEAVRRAHSVKTVLIVTSDKVYANADHGEGFSESDVLGGKDPYSASKAACELVVKAWRETYFTTSPVRIATVRGGNVIGGGDFSEDRLVPDAVRAARAGTRLVLRHPQSTRPWQHVLDCLSGYLSYVEALATQGDTPLALNIGPAPGAEMAVGELASRVLESLGTKDAWEHQEVPGSVEMKALAISSELAKTTLGWRGSLSIDDAVGWTTSWYRAWAEGRDMRAICQSDIARYKGLTT